MAAGAAKGGAAGGGGSDRSAGRIAEENRATRVLIVEDSPLHSRLARALLVNQPGEFFDFTWVQRLDEAIANVRETPYDVVLLDLNLADSVGLDTLTYFHAAAPELPIVVMTGQDDGQLGVRALRLGAQDFCVKGLRDGRTLARAIRYAIERNRTVQLLQVARERERYLATHDRLTQLPNRSLLLDRAAHALEVATRNGGGLAILFLDVDHFKNLNDSLGHATGDGILKLVGHTLRSCIRASDTSARVGGDEFAILLEGLEDGLDATRVAREISSRLSRPRVVNGRDVSVTASIGIAVFPRDGITAEALLQNADAAMYHLKQRGRDGYAFFSDEIDAQAKRHLELEGDLRTAVDRGQLVAHFQPQVDVTRNAIVGAEALARWNHSTLGWIGPDEFVPLAERRGLIIPLGEHILRLACEATRQWPSRLRVAVNVAARQLSHGNFVETVARVLQATELPYERLELEITERSLMADRKNGVAALRALREQGVRVAIDDFGTGYSCLGALKELPVDVIKIDQSFVKSLLSDRRDAAIVETMLKLARDLDLDIVAEGVETPAQRDHLLDLGCHQMQGYLFGRPLHAAAFRRRFAGDRTARAAGPAASRLDRDRSR